MFKGINHITVVVSNKLQASIFYFETLNFERVDVGKSLWAKVGNQYIHINEDLYIENQKSFRHFAIEVENLDIYLKELISKGVEIFDYNDKLGKIDINENLDKPGRNYFISDPFDNVIEFIDTSNSFFKQ